MMNEYIERGPALHVGIHQAHPPTALEAGVPQVPIPSFVEKSDWLRAFDDFRRVYPDLNRETP